MPMRVWPTAMPLICNHLMSNGTITINRVWAGQTAPLASLPYISNKDLVFIFWHLLFVTPYHDGDAVGGCTDSVNNRTQADSQHTTSRRCHLRHFAVSPDHVISISRSDHVHLPRDSPFSARTRSPSWVSVYTCFIKDYIYVEPMDLSGVKSY